MEQVLSKAALDTMRWWWANASQQRIATHRKALWSGVSPMFLSSKCKEEKQCLEGKV